MTISDAIAASDVPAALRTFDEEIARGCDPWDIHLSLFPVVQGVQNPPFINPHLPKMHAICREFIPDIRTTDNLTTLVRLEVEEYARRPKLSPCPRHGGTGSGVTFADIEAAIAGGNIEETTTLMSAYAAAQGQASFARKMLLLGSGYLDDSLGHSISCTAFILLEMMIRQDQDPWPVMAALADYFIKGIFTTTPPTDGSAVSDDEMGHHLLRATSGRGIVNLHHTITIYAIDRIRHLFTHDEQNHLVRTWISFLGDKDTDLFVVPSGTSVSSKEGFSAAWAAGDTETVMAAVTALLGDRPGQIREHLVSGVCSLYNGNYNPHNLTGLGSALWATERYAKVPGLAANALRQYIDYFFAEIGQ